MALKKCKAVEYDENGMAIFNLDCDAANTNWIAAARLQKTGRAEDKEKLDKMFKTPLYEEE